MRGNVLANRKERYGGTSTTRNRGECCDGDNDIPPDQREHKIWGLHWLLRTMSVVDLYILNFCLGFSAGRYIYFWNVLKENFGPEDCESSEEYYKRTT